jgi:uncharacterized protein (DUF924 family)
MSDPRTVLEYWLETVGQKGWYEVNPEVDAEITASFGALWKAAHDGGLDHWIDGPLGCLAFVILTDQFSRNMFRGQARAFSTDAKARAAARKALAHDWDQECPVPARQFFFLPFEHSEDLDDQALAVDCFVNRMDNPETALHARAHQAIIQRFGRFPFRNLALGRVSTPEEEKFMAEGGYGAIVQGLRTAPG